MIDRSLNYGRHNIRNFLKKSVPFQNVLDLGAGSGFDLHSARSVNPSATLFAVELFDHNIASLKSLNIKVYQLNIEKDTLPFEDRSIDVIIANQIMEHTKEIFWIMHETSRILKVGGKLLLGVPNLASFHNRILLLAGKQPTPIQLQSAHVRGFTKSGLRNFLNIFTGYTLLDFKGSNFYPFPPVMARPLAKMLPSLAWGIFFHLTKTKAYANEYLNYLDSQQLETFYYHGKQA